METEDSLKFHNSLTLVSTLSQMNPVHNITPYFCKIYFNIVLQSTSMSPKRYFSSRLPTKIMREILVSLIHNTWLAHLSFLVLTTLVITEPCPAPVTSSSLERKHDL